MCITVVEVAVTVMQRGRFLLHVRKRRTNYLEQTVGRRAEVRMFLKNPWKQMRNMKTGGKSVFFYSDKNLDECVLVFL